MTITNMQPITETRYFYDEEYEHHIGRSWNCHCGAVVESYYGADTDCDRCRRVYNAFGQELRPPEEWTEPWDEDSYY